MDDEDEYYWDYESSDTYIFSRMQLSDMGHGAGSSPEAVSQVEKEKERQYQWILSDGDYVKASLRNSKLKNGREVYRSYAVGAVKRNTIHQEDFMTARIPHGGLSGAGTDPE